MDYFMDTAVILAKFVGKLEVNFIFDEKAVNNSKVFINF